MRIAILSRGPNLYSTRRLVETAAARGHDVRVFDTLRFDFLLRRGEPELYYDGEPMPGVDAVIPRIGASITAFGLAVVRQFEMMGTYCLNASPGIARSRDKLRCLQILSRQHLGMPRTVYTRQPGHVKACIELAGGVPVVVKLLEGTQGVGVVLAETNAVAESIIEAFQGIDQNILIQQFIKESRGADVRAFVVGRRIVAAMRRQACKGEFRSNLHRGGKATKIHLPPPFRKAALAATKALELRVAGVDLLEANDGPMILEVNSSPGLEGIEKATGVDVAGAIVKFLEREVPGRKPRPFRD